MSQEAESGILSALRLYRDQMRRVATVLLVLSILGLSIFGVFMLYSTSSATHGEALLIKQAKWIGVGIIGAAILYFFDYRWICRHRGKVLLAAALPLAYLAGAHIAVMRGVPAAQVDKLPFLHGVNGAYRWLFFGSYSVQPGELAKLAIIIFVAGYYGSHPRWAPKLKRGVVYPLLLVGPVLLLVLLGGSLSITVITGAVLLTMLFVAGVRLRYFCILGLASVLMITGVLALSTSRLKRVTESWFNPEAYRKTTGYQLYHSQLALGSGGMWGLGPNRSRMKEAYLPEAHTDFIMAIVGEELGFASMVGVMLVYLLLVGSAFWISAMAADRQGMLLGVGIGVSVGIHALINLAVVSGALPTTGVTAPLISYGGSSMLLTWLGIGLLGSIARVAQDEEFSEPVAVVRAIPGLEDPMEEGEMST